MDYEKARGWLRKVHGHLTISHRACEVEFGLDALLIIDDEVIEHSILIIQATGMMN